MNTQTAILDDSATDLPHILCVKFNQDQGCFAIGHENGFLVYNSNPIDLRVKRDLQDGEGNGLGIGKIAMLHRTNYLALVGGGKNPKFSQKKVIMWDDLKRKNSLNLNFESPVLDVLLSRIRIVVVLRDKVVIHSFSSPPKVHSVYETIDNEEGLCDMSVVSVSNDHDDNTQNGNRSHILAFPGRFVGQIQVVDMSLSGQEKNVVKIVKAHKAKIRCLAVNRTGTLLASASIYGTIIRVHSTRDTALIHEFRRGLDKATITSLKFSPDSSKLAVLSDKNTLHVFKIDALESKQGLNSHQEANNRHHILSKMPFPIPFSDYFNSTWSFCSVNTTKYHVLSKDEEINDIGVIAWSGNDSILLVWHNKKIWEKYVITKKTDISQVPAHGREDNEAQGSTEWAIDRSGWKRLDSFT